MKLNFKQICAWVLLTTLIGAPGFGALPPTTTKGQLDAGKTTTFNFEAPAYQITKTGSTTGLIETGSTNLLRNPSFEATTFSDGWTRTGAGTWTTGAALGLGVKSLSWDPTGPGETITGTAVTIPNSFRGKTGELVCQVQVPSGANNGEIVAWNGSAAIGAFASFDRIVAGSTTSTEIRTSFLFPTSGTITARFTSGSSEDPVLIDDCRLGLATNITSTSINTPWTVYAPVIGSATGTLTNYTATFSWRRADTNIQIRGKIVFTGAAGTWSAPIIPFPSGVVADTSLIQTGQINSTIGEVKFTDVGVQDFLGNIRLDTTTQGMTFYNFTGNSASNPVAMTNGATQATPLAFAAGDAISYEMDFPVAGWTASTAVNANQQRTPTVTRLLSGSGTYNTPVGATYLRVRMIGAGGGGAGSGTTGQTAGGAASVSTFGTSLLTANGGAGGALQSGGVLNSAAGGTASISAPATGSPFTGSYGGAGQYVGSSTAYPAGGMGGVGAFGGGGGTSNAGNGAAGAANGSGGGGGGASTTGTYTGSGGAAGGFVDAMIAAPAASYGYVCAAGGTAGAAGTSGATGSVGAPCLIEVTEYYGYTVALLANSVRTLDNPGVTTVNTVTTLTGGSYTALDTDETFIGVQSGGAITLNLPAAASSKGKKYHISYFSGANSILIDPAGSETVCGNATVRVYGDNDTITIQSDGTRWHGLNNTCQRHEYFVTSAGDCTAGACAFISRSTAASLTWTGTGEYTAVFGISFSQVPACTYSTAGAANIHCSSGTVLVSGFPMRCFSPSVATNTRPVFSCVGPR